MPGPRSTTSWTAPPARTSSPESAGSAPTEPTGAGSAGSPGPDDAPAPPGEQPAPAADAGERPAGEEPGTAAGGARPAASAVAPVVQGDWLASVCPYLTSEDGSYRSATADEGHRCVAVDPPATLPLAFQERFCLTDRHPRCEMYKYAQEVGQDGGIPVPATQLQAAATRPVQATSASGRGSSSRPAIIAAAGVGGIAILVLLLVLVMGSCAGGDSGTDGAASSEPATTEEPQPEPTPEPEPQATPEPEPEATPEAEPDATADPDADTATQGLTILYEIQEGEALLRVAETFGVTRRRILRANPGLEEVAPADLPGETIEIPLPAGSLLEELEALPGYRGPVP